jgi:hypothetical protein
LFLALEITISQSINGIVHSLKLFQDIADI